MPSIIVIVILRSTICPAFGRVKRDHRHYYHQHFRNIYQHHGDRDLGHRDLGHSIKVLRKDGWTLAAPHPTPPIWAQHQHLAQGRGNVVEHPHPTPHASRAWRSCARSRERGRRNVNISTLPHVSVASNSCARSRERGWRNVSIPTPPYPAPCECSTKILCKVEGTWSKKREHPHPTPGRPMWA